MIYVLSILAIAIIIYLYLTINIWISERRKHKEISRYIPLIMLPNDSLTEKILVDLKRKIQKEELKMADTALDKLMDYREAYYLLKDGDSRSIPFINEIYFK